MQANNNICRENAQTPKYGKLNGFGTFTLFAQIWLHLTLAYSENKSFFFLFKRFGSYEERFDRYFVDLPESQFRDKILREILDKMQWSEESTQNSKTIFEPKNTSWELFTLSSYMNHGIICCYETLMEYIKSISVVRLTIETTQNVVPPFFIRFLCSNVFFLWCPSKLAFVWMTYFRPL